MQETSLRRFAGGIVVAMDILSNHVSTSDVISEAQNDTK